MQRQYVLSVLGLSFFFIFVAHHPAFVGANEEEANNNLLKGRPEETPQVDLEEFKFSEDFGMRRPLTQQDDTMLRKRREKMANDTDPEGIFFCRPGQYTGTIDGAEYVFIMPPRWNGILVIYAHGYSFDIPPPAAFYANPDWPTDEPTAQSILLEQGYALAGSAFSAGGWSVKEGIHDTIALVKNIRRLIGGYGCWPSRTVLFGVSMGSLIALRQAEVQGFWDWWFDGIVAGCPLTAGATRMVDLSLLFNLAFDAAFLNGTTGAWPPEWGTPQNIPPNFDFDYEVLPILLELLYLPEAIGAFEFQRLISFLSADDYYPSPTDDGTLLTDFYFSTQAISEIETRAGGPVSQNLGNQYSLQPAEIEYLASLGFPAAPSLAFMNANNQFAAPPTARDYLKKYADLSGKIRMPVLTMHTFVDGLAPPTGDTLYKASVEAAGCSRLLYQTYTTGAGHCNFTQKQLVTAINTMAKWLCGRRPRPEDFPAEAGFLPPSYSPGPWPYAAYGIN